MITRDLDFFLDDGRKEMPFSVSAKEVRCKVALPLSNLPGLDLALNPYVGCEHWLRLLLRPGRVEAGPV